MAVFDHFDALDHYRAHICFDQDKLTDIEKAFDLVKENLLPFKSNIIIP
jgi:hypothetical protein